MHWAPKQAKACVHERYAMGLENPVSDLCSSSESLHCGLENLIAMGIELRSLTGFYQRCIASEHHRSC